MLYKQIIQYHFNNMFENDYIVVHLYAWGKNFTNRKIEKIFI